MSQPSFYQEKNDIISSAKQRIDELKNRLETAYERWEVLETIREGNQK
jgi:hypothetical protein